MTDTGKPFDAAIHKFGMAYKSKIYSVIHPFRVQDSSLGEYFEFMFEGRIQDEFCSRMERSPEHDLVSVSALIDRKEAEALLIDALEALARLGNGDRYGNSDGNIIAQNSLAAFRKRQTEGK